MFFVFSPFDTIGVACLVHGIWATKVELATLQHPGTQEAREPAAHLLELLTVPVPAIGVACQPVAGRRPRKGKIRQEPHTLQVPAARQPRADGRRAPHYPCIMERQQGSLQRPRRRPAIRSGKALGATSGCAPRRGPPHKIHHRPPNAQVSNQDQRPVLKHTPFSIMELHRALDRLNKGVVLGVGGSLAEPDQCLTMLF